MFWAGSLKDDWSFRRGSKLVLSKEKWVRPMRSCATLTSGQSVSYMEVDSIQTSLKLPNTNGMSSLPFSSLRVAGVKEVILHRSLANLGVRKFSGRVSYSLFPHFPFGTRCCKCLISSRQGCKRVASMPPYRFAAFDALAPLVLSRWS